MRLLRLIGGIFRKPEPKPLVHVHDWKFNCYMGRPEGTPKSYPMSEYYLCSCGGRAIRHYGQEITILK